MFNRSTAKLVANLVVTSSVGGVVRQIISNNIAEPETTKEKIEVAVGSFAIGGLVAERCWNRTEEQIDKIADLISEWRSENPDTPAE